MDFSQVFEDLKDAKLAARRYEREGHAKFRDCVTVVKGGKLLFERFCWGEAASLTFGMKGTPMPDGSIEWQTPVGSYSAADEAPKQLTGYENGAMFFDNIPKKWLCECEMKKRPKAKYK